MQYHSSLKELEEFLKKQCNAIKVSNHYTGKPYPEEGIYEVIYHLPKQGVTLKATSTESSNHFLEIFGTNASELERVINKIIN